MRALYNEIEPFACEWLRNLERAGEIAVGVVDGRSIAELQPADLVGIDRFHAFAGLGGWDRALRVAGWPDDVPVWTGSCPCQSWSQAGRGAGAEDERHLWPEWFRLIRACRPAFVFGEQVASKKALEWLDIVASDLEGLGYEFVVADFPAAAVGAPHIRQRLYFAAVAPSEDREAASHALRAFVDVQLRVERAGDAWRSEVPGAARDAASGEGSVVALADAEEEARRRARGLDRAPGWETVEPDRHGDARVAVADHDEGGRALVGAARLHDPGQSGNDVARRGASGGVADNERDGSQRGLDALAGQGEVDRRRRRSADESAARCAVGDAGLDGDREHARELRGDEGEHDERPPDRDHTSEPSSTARPVAGFWADAEWIPCRDGKARPAEPGTFPLADGATARVGRLRAAGNAIVVTQAVAMIRAVMESL